MKTQNEIEVTRCTCLKCDPTGRRFARVFGYNPVEGEDRKRRRTSEEVALERRRVEEKRARVMKEIEEWKAGAKR